MSRVGKYPVTVPSEVTLTLREGKITAQGKCGTLSLALRSEIEIFIEQHTIWIKPRVESKFARALWGTTRANIYNMVFGVDQGFSRRLDIVGVGYRAAVKGRVLTMALGFSHDVVYIAPDDVVIECDTPTTVTVRGASKERVGQIAAEIRAYRPPEPYKGKGIRYAEEQVLRKEGKKK